MVNKKSDNADKDKEPKRYDKRLTFTVPGIPPSYNKSIKINYRLRQIHLTQEARRFKDKVKIHMPYWELPDRVLLFSVRISYNSDWYYKNKKVRKKDVQNLDKLLIDAMFKALGRDDSFLFKVTNEKIQSIKEFTRVELEVVNKERYRRKEKE